MAPQPPIAGMTVADLVSAIAADRPAPGAGVAGAVALALGIACLRKALRISGRHHPADSAADRFEGPLAAACATALEYGQLDAACFDALIAAMRLPHDDEAAAAARTAAIDEANVALSANSRRMLGICDDARGWLAAADGRIDDAMAGDVVAARALIEAARTIDLGNLAESDRPIG